MCETIRHQPPEATAQKEKRKRKKVSKFCMQTLPCYQREVCIRIDLNRDEKNLNFHSKSIHNKISLLKLGETKEHVSGYSYNAYQKQKLLWTPAASKCRLRCGVSCSVVLVLCWSIFVFVKNYLPLVISLSCVVYVAFPMESFMESFHDMFTFLRLL